MTLSRSSHSPMWIGSWRTFRGPGLYTLQTHFVFTIGSRGFNGCKFGLHWQSKFWTPGQHYVPTSWGQFLFSHDELLLLHWNFVFCHLDLDSVTRFRVHMRKYSRGPNSKGRAVRSLIYESQHDADISSNPFHLDRCKSF